MKTEESVGLPTVAFSDLRPHQSRATSPHFWGLAAPRERPIGPPGRGIGAADRRHAGTDLPGGFARRLNRSRSPHVTRGSKTGGGAIGACCLGSITQQQNGCTLRKEQKKKELLGRHTFQEKT